MTKLQAMLALEAALTKALNVQKDGQLHDLIWHCQAVLWSDFLEECPISKGEFGTFLDAQQEALLELATDTEVFGNVPK
jgi:hypothetical protein